MRKLLVIFLALILILSTVGCAKDKEPAVTEPTKEEHINDWGPSKFNDVTELKFKIQEKEIELPMKYSDFCELFEFEVSLTFTDERYDEDGKKSLLCEQIININGYKMGVVITNYQMDASYNEEKLQQYMGTGDIIGLTFYTEEAIKPECISNVDFNNDINEVISTLGQDNAADKKELVLQKFGTPDVQEHCGMRYNVKNWTIENEENVQIEFWFSASRLQHVKFGIFQLSF